MKPLAWAVVVALAAACAWAARRSAVPRRAHSPNAEAKARFPSFDEFGVLSDLHLRRAKKMLAEFEATFQKTFASCDRNLVVDLHEQRSRALASLYELRMRLPNDLAAYDTLTDRIERVERTTLVLIDDANQRCRLGLLHLAPVGDHYYAHWYRAADDVRE